MENDNALTRFVQIKSEIDSLLAALTAASEDNFGKSPEDINLQRVFSLELFKDRLKIAAKVLDIKS